MTQGFIQTISTHWIQGCRIIMWVASVGGAVLEIQTEVTKQICMLYVSHAPRSRCHVNNAFISLLANTSHNTATHIHNTIIETLLHYMVREKRDTLNK